MNLLNKLYIALLLLLTFATGYKIIRYYGTPRYYYTASFTAPRTYPVFIHNSYFILPYNKMGIISDDNVNDQRGTYWGAIDVGGEADGKQQLPLKLVMEYASYRDRAFYRDTIDLPVEKMKTIFAGSKAKGIRKDLYVLNGSHNGDGLHFFIGVANNGNIKVWLQGRNYEELLVKHHIQAAEPKGNQTFYGKKLSKNQFLDRVFSVDDDIKKDIEKGKERTANYIDSASHYLETIRQK